MNKQWTVHFINHIAEKEIEAFSPDLQARFLHIIDLLIEFGPHHVSLPHVRFMEDKIWEMRLKGKDNIARCLYFLASQKQITVLYSFIKKTQETPRKAIKIAKERMKEIKNDPLC